MDYKEKCDGCFRKFTSYLINPMYTKGKVEMLCPLCARAIRNAMHGLPENTPFGGEIANQYYQEALKEAGLI